MKKIGIEINGVLRDTISKFIQLYEKNMIEERMCVKCREAINPLRLKALPTAKTCVPRRDRWPEKRYRTSHPKHGGYC